MENVKAAEITETQDLSCKKPRPRVLSIEAACIAEIDNQFFLLVELEIDIPRNEVERVVVIPLKPAVAQALIRAGVDVCRIVNEIPESRPGQEVEFLCVLNVDDRVFLVFEVENCDERLVLVRARLCKVIGDCCC